MFFLVLKAKDQLEQFRTHIPHPASESWMPSADPGNSVPLGGDPKGYGKVFPPDRVIRARL